MSDTPRYAYDAPPPVSHGGSVPLPKRTPPKGGYPPKAQYRPGSFDLGLGEWKNNSQTIQQRNRANNPNQVCKVCKEKPLGKRQVAYEARMCTDCYREDAFQKRREILAKDHDPCVICGKPVYIAKGSTLSRYMKIKTCSQTCTRKLGGYVAMDKRWNINGETME